MPAHASNSQSSTGAMSYRTLGRTGEKVSCIGLGGFHLGQSHLEEPDAIKLFQAAVDRGINFSDNSWDYNQGASEKRVGKALQGRRENVFVMTKFDGRTKGSALSQLDESLQCLEVDGLDLWQFHENTFTTWTENSSRKTRMVALAKFSNATRRSGLDS